MNPRRLDPASVGRRLAELRRKADHLEELLPVTAQQLEEQWRTRALVEHLVEQMVELAVAINLHLAATSTGEVPEQYRSSFMSAAEIGALPQDLAERLAPAAGLRNLVVHDYLDIDLALLAESVASAPAEFRAYVTAVARWLADHEDTQHE